MGFLQDWLTAWRDFAVDGVPSSGPNAPDKGSIRALGKALTDLIGAVGPSTFAGSSSTSITIATGAQAFTTQPSLSYFAGQRLIAAADATHWMEGVVTSYSGTTLIINVDTSSGSGTFASWSLGPAGQKGGAGSAGGAITVSPDYANPGGQGDRATPGTVVVTASPTLITNATRLVDGSTSSSAQFSAISVAGLFILFDLLVGAAKVITEAIWTQSTAATHGVWQWQGSNDGATFVNIGATFTLGGFSGANILSTLSANQTGFRYYRLLGISGTASAQPGLQEITFKIGSTVLDGPQAPLLAASAAAVTAPDADHGQSVATTGFVDRAVYNARKIPSKFTSFFPVDEEAGTVLHDVLGGRQIDLTTGGGTKAWTKGGHLQMSANAWFKTPSMPAQVMGVLYRVPEGNSDVYFLSSPTGKAMSTAVRGGTASIINARVLTGWGIHQVTARNNAARNEVGELGSGGWTLTVATFVASETGTFIVGAGNATGSGASAATWEIAGIFFASADPTDAECRLLLTAIRPLYKGRNIYLTPQDCPQRRVLAVVAGESTGEGTYLLSTGLTATQQGTFSQTAFVNAYNAASAATAGKRMLRANFNVTAGTQNNNPPSTNTKFGCEWGVVNARNARADDGRFLDILKVSQGSTYLLPAGTYTAADGGSVTLAVSQVRSSDNLGDLSTGTGLFYTLEVRGVLRAEQQARNQGIGYTTVCFLQPEGLNDAYIGTNAITSAAQYQTMLQNQYNARLACYGLSSISVTYLKPHHPNGAANTLGGIDTGYPNNATGSNRQAAIEFIRTAVDSMVAANPTCSKLDGDSYSLNASSPDLNVHPDANGYNAMGQAWEALIPYTTEFQAAA